MRKPEVKIFSLCSDEYAGLAKLTVDENKRAYCKLHGYDLIDLRVRSTSMRTVGWERIEAILELFSKNRDNSSEWIWVMGVDTMIMNFKRRLEEFIDRKFHFIIAEDAVYRLNADSFMVRNTPEGRCWLEFILSMRKVYRNHGYCEQGTMIDWYQRPPFSEWIKTAPQTGPQGINAYDSDFLLRFKLEPGQIVPWQRGDFLLHWAGASLKTRLQEAAKASREVIKPESNFEYSNPDPDRIWTSKTRFDFEDFYTRIAAWLPSDSIVAEVGMMDNSSSRFLLKKIKEAGKNVKLWIIDSHAEMANELDVEVDLRKRLESISRFPDVHFDFVFLGMGDFHEKEPIKAEIRLWWGKIKEGGILAGHGYLSKHHPNLSAAVNEVIPNPYTRPPLIRGDRVQQSFEEERILEVHKTKQGHGIWSVEKKFYVNLL